MGPQKCVSQDLTGLQTAGTLGTREFKGRDCAGLSDHGHASGEPGHRAPSVLCPSPFSVVVPLLILLP